MGKQMLEVKDLSLTIKGKLLLNKINLEIKKDEYFVILGATGSGKTLLLESIAGLNKIQGEICFEGRDYTHKPLEDRRFGIVYQDLSLFPHMNVFENLAFPLKMKGQFSKNKVTDMAEQLSISHLLDRDIKHLSGGEKQKTAIARTLLSQPDLLLLDEPFSALDASFKKEMYSFIKSIHQQYQLSCIHITHSFEEAMALADRIAIIQNGEILQVGHPIDIFKSPKNKFVAEFVGTDNLIELEHKDNKSYIKGIDIELCEYLPDKKNVIIHSHDIILSRDIPSSSARFCLKAEIIEIKDMLMFTEVRVILNDCKDICIHIKITHHSLEQMMLKEHDQIFILFKESALYFL